jgi:hypothetical protein
MMTVMLTSARPLAALAITFTLVAGCGDDSPAGTGGGGGSDASTTTASTTTGSSTSGTTTGAGGDGATGTGGETGTGGAGGSGDGGSAGGEPAACLTAEALDLLQQHLDEMSRSAELLAGHRSAAEATGFLLAPALPSPPGVGALYASLIAPCDGQAYEYEPYCDQGTCSRIGCTGEGAGWRMTTWIEEPYEGDGFATASAEVVNTWTEDATGTEVAIAVVATGPDDRDWSFVGTGAFDEEGLALAYSFDAWVGGEPAEMLWVVDADGTIGEIAAGDVVVAAIGDDGHFELTGDCP